MASDISCSCLGVINKNLHRSIIQNQATCGGRLRSHHSPNGHRSQVTGASNPALCAVQTPFDCSTCQPPVPPWWSSGACKCYLSAQCLRWSCAWFASNVWFGSDCSWTWTWFDSENQSRISNEYKIDYFKQGDQLPESKEATAVRLSCQWQLMHHSFSSSRGRMPSCNCHGCEVMLWCSSQQMTRTIASCQLLRARRPLARTTHPSSLAWVWWTWTLWLRSLTRWPCGCCHMTCMPWGSQLPSSSRTLGLLHQANCHRVGQHAS